MHRLPLIIGVLTWGIALAAETQSGTVRSAGQALPGAAITAAQGAQKLSTVTDEAGRYQLDLPSAGTWQIEVEMFGFAASRREIQADAPLPPLDFNLDLKSRPPAVGPRGPGGRAAAGFQNVTLNQNTDAQVTEALNAAQAAPPPESANANEAFLVSGSVSQGLAAVQQEDAFGPGRADGGNRGDSPFGGRGGGGRGGFGDGGPRQRGGNRPDGMGPPSFGNRANRAAQNRNALRGALFFTLGNSALDARPFAVNGQTAPKPSYSSARFGLTAGGMLNIPKVVRSDKTFFFVNYFGTRSKNPFSAVTTVPTDLERAGFFTAPIYDPLDRLPFAGNRIPLERFDRAALGLLAFIPHPNQPGDIQNYQFTTSVRQNTDNLGIRLNHTLSRKDRLDLNFNMQMRDARGAQTYGFTDESSGSGLNVSLGWSHTFAHQIINNVRANFSRNRSNTVPYFAFSRNVAAELGINGVSSDPINYGPPNVSFTNFGALSDASPVLRRDQTAGITESANVVHGQHSISFGGEFRRQQLNQLTDQNGRGSFTFSGFSTSAFNAQGQPLPGTGFDFADFLLGLPQSSSVRFGTSSTYFRGSVYNLFTMEEWRARPNLTLNLGLRYEYFTPLREKYNHIANLDIAPGFSAVAPVTPGQTGPYSGVFPDGLINPDKNLFSPRLALAWRPIPSKQLQIRAGYGIFYNGSIYSQFPSRLASQPPFAKTASLVTSLSHPLSIENGFAAIPSESITNSYAVDRNYRLGYAQTWSFSIQQSLKRSFVIELGYLGTKGTRLDIQRLPNRAAPGSPLTAEQRRQIGNAVGFTFDSSEGNSIYHAAQVRVTRRFARGISANAFYTFAKSIDNASTLGGGSAVVAQNDKDLRAERGLSSFDQRHTLNLSYVLTSPVSENGLLRGSGIGQTLLKDWTLSGGLTASSGIPFTARVLGNQSDTAGTGSVGSGRANATGLPVQSGPGFFNPSAFTIPLPGTFGDAGRNTIPGPAQLSLNLSFGRSFRLDEKRRAEFRIESNNFTNHVSIASINTVVNASTYGLPLAANRMRTVTATVRLRF